MTNDNLPASPFTLRVTDETVLPMTDYPPSLFELWRAGRLLLTTYYLLLTFTDHRLPIPPLPHGLGVPLRRNVIVPTANAPISEYNH